MSYALQSGGWLVADAATAFSDSDYSDFLNVMDHNTQQYYLKGQKFLCFQCDPGYYQSTDGVCYNLVCGDLCVIPHALVDVARLHRFRMLPQYFICRFPISVIYEKNCLSLFVGDHQIQIRKFD